jgi:hypothetical protein
MEPWGMLPMDAATGRLLRPRRRASAGMLLACREACAAGCAAAAVVTKDGDPATAAVAAAADARGAPDCAAIRLCRKATPGGS